LQKDRRGAGGNVRALSLALLLSDAADAMVPAASQWREHF